MADAKKCDKCERLYEIYDGIPITEKGLKCNVLRLSNNSIYRTYDLCPTCMTQVIAFLNNHKEPVIDGESRCCKTCKYDGMGLDVCMGCTTGNYEMWKEKNNDT